MSEDLNKLRELASSLVSVHHHAPEVELRLYRELADEAGPAIINLIDALASITRERDEAIADKHNLIATQLNELAMIGLARESEEAEATETIKRLTRERDAMREVEKVARDLAANIEQDSGGLWFVNSEDPEAPCCTLLGALNAASLTKGGADV